MATGKMLRWRVQAVDLPLRYAWVISRNSSAVKTNIFVWVTDGETEAAGEAAPNIRYNETPEILLKAFENIHSRLPENTDVPPQQLAKLLEKAKVPNALRFAIESAYIHYLCSKKNISVSDFLELPYMQKVATTYSLPIMPVEQLGHFIKTYNLNRFQILKIKINQAQGLELISEVSKHTNRPLLIDANESFTDADAVLDFAEKIKPFNILLLEQPLPSAQKDGYIYLKQKMPYALFADESMTDAEDISHLQQQFHGVNMKLMKAGGYLRGVQQLKQAKQLGMRTMVGCMVETSLGIQSAMNVAALAEFCDLDGFLILKEDPFKLLQEANGEIVR